MSAHYMYLPIVFIVHLFSLTKGNLPRTDVTVSGISSGAAMATQLHIAFSGSVSGCGILAGPPYYCGGNGMTTAWCMTGPAAYISVPVIQYKIKSYSSSGSIDDSSKLKNDPVYVFSGKYDTVAYPGVVKLNADLYSRLGANVKTNFDMAASHGFPTENFGSQCASLNAKNYLNDCKFNMAYDMLNHLYGGNLIKPRTDSKTTLNGEMFLFDQEAFINLESTLSLDENETSTLFKWIQQNIAVHKFNDRNVSTISNRLELNMPDIKVPLNEKPRITTKSSSSAGFDEEGFVYFPTACINGTKCSIHVALHGCQQGKSYVGDIFATKAGYLEVAELNNIIVVFPQILRSLVFPTNPMGCWDWWGYSSMNYATRGGPQMSGIMKMTSAIRMINAAFGMLH